MRWGRERAGRARFALIAIVLVAFVVRLGAVAATPDYIPTGDPADYDRLAIALATTGELGTTTIAQPGGPSALRPPLYPVVLAATYEATGARWTAARLLGCLLGALTVLLVVVLAERTFTRPVAVWAGGLAAIYPPLVWLSAGLSAENLFIPLVLASMLALSGFARTGTIKAAAAAGLLIGLATLTRSNGLVLLLAGLLAAATVAHAGRSDRLRAALALVAACCVALLPWTVRNAVAFDRFLPLGTQSGYTIAGMYNPDAARRDRFEAIWRTPQDVERYSGAFRRLGVDEADLDRDMRSRGLDFAAEHPGYVLRAATFNALRMFDLGPNHQFTRATSYREMGVPAALVPGMTTWLHLTVVAALVGAGLVVRRRVPVPAWLLATPALLLLSVLFVTGSPRYRIPLDPFILLFASVALSAAWSAARRRQRAS